MALAWTTADMPSLAGRIALVTGANRGLGLEIAVGLAAAGARVVIACRDPERAGQALRELQRRVPQAQAEAIALDLADLASVRRCAESFAARHPRLDLLCNNAAAILVPQGRTRDGFETHIGTNHLGPFALTGLLLERLRAAPAARVINTSSLAHRMTQGMDLDDLHGEHRPYRPMDAYARSKLATLLFTLELDRRLKRAGIPMLATAAHPGYANTNPELGGFFMRLATRLFAQPAARGALPALYAASAPDVQGGELFGPAGYRELKGPPTRVDCRSEARDAELAGRLWALSERLTGVRYLS